MPTSSGIINKSESKIHPSAIIHLKACIASGVEIGPYSVIGKDVTIGENTYIGSHVIIDGMTEIGANCKLVASCSIGLPPQDLSYKDEQTGVKIGENTVIREYVTIHRAAKEGFTQIGKNCFLMNCVHVGHNVRVGNNVIVASSSLFGGYAEVDDYAFIGGLSAVHQYCRIGESVMLAGMSGARQDVPPYFIADDRPAKIRGVNKVGLRRRSIKREVINEIEKAYKIIYLSNLNTSNALEKIEKELVQFDEIKKLLNFFRTTKRGIATVSSSKDSDSAEGSL